MTLPVSGALTLAQIQTEFGGSDPIGMNEYYSGGGIITNNQLPTSGPISMADFYGKSSIIREPTSGELYNYEDGSGTYFWELWSAEYSGGPYIVSIAWNADHVYSSGYLVAATGGPSISAAYRIEGQPHEVTSIVRDGYTYHRGAPITSWQDGGDYEIYAIYRTKP